MEKIASRSLENPLPYKGDVSEEGPSNEPTIKAVENKKENPTKIRYFGVYVRGLI